MLLKNTYNFEKKNQTTTCGATQRICSDVSAHPRGEVGDVWTDEVTQKRL